MNILYTIWDTSYGGAETNLLSYLRKLDRTKFTPFILSHAKTAGNMEEEFLALGIKVIHAPCNRFLHPIRYIRHIQKAVLDCNIDLIHGNDDMNMFFAAVATDEATPLVAHSHTSSPVTFRRHKIISAIFYKIAKTSINRRKAFGLACSEEAGCTMFDNTPFLILPNSIDIDKFQFSIKSRESIRKELDITEDDIVLLHVGRLVLAKNHTFLLDVLANYRELNKRVKLVIVGTGTEEGSIRERINELGLKDNVVLLGLRTDVDKLYSAADLLIMPSHFEGMPVVSVEAQANGLRCLFSNNISTEANQTGFIEFLPLESGPKKWAQHIARMSLSRHDSTDKLEDSRYNIKKSVNELENIYLSVLRKEQDVRMEGVGNE